MNPQSRRCTARRRDGRPCRSWAVSDGGEPLCASHRKARQRAASQQPRQTEPGALGVYEEASTVEEAADLLYSTQATDLKDELRVTRVAVRQILLRLQNDLDPAEYARLIALIFKGTHTIAGILRVQRSLSADDDDLLQPEIRAALDQMSAEKGYDL